MERNLIEFKNGVKVKIGEARVGPSHRLALAELGICI